TSRTSPSPRTSGPPSTPATCAVCSGHASPAEHRAHRRAGHAPTPALTRPAGPHPRRESAMARRPIGIIMNGVTGRMGYRQHLVRSILAIREQGGLALADGTVVWPEPVLVGRNEEKLRALAARHGLEHWTTDLDAALADPANEIYFDAQLTQV